MTGAVLPAFNHPLKLAGELAMLDAINGGRLDIGFARAFLPHEFRHFGVSMDESVARFEEGIEQVHALLEGEHVSLNSGFHRFENVTSLPRPTQQPRPPFYIAAIGTPASFVRAGRLGYSLMAIPGVGPPPTELVQTYREAWRSAGHPGHGTIALAVFMYCHVDRKGAIRIAFWDFDASPVPDTPRNVSGAGIAAAALLNLAPLVRRRPSGHATRPPPRPWPLQPAEPPRDPEQADLGLILSLSGPPRAEWSPPAAPDLRTGSGMDTRETPATTGACRQVHGTQMNEDRK